MYRTERKDSVLAFELTDYIANRKCGIKIAKKKNTRYIIEEKNKLKKMDLLKKEICKQFSNDKFNILSVSHRNDSLNNNSLEVATKHDSIKFILHENLLFEIVYTNRADFKYTFVKEDETGVKLYVFQQTLREAGAHYILKELVKYAYSLFF